MATTKTVSSVYLLGIKEGRSFLRNFKPTHDEMRRLLATATELAKRGGEVGELYKGERDFWANQLKKKTSATGKKNPTRKRAAKKRRSTHRVSAVGRKNPSPGYVVFCVVGKRKWYLTEPTHKGVVGSDKKSEAFVFPKMAGARHAVSALQSRNLISSVTGVGYETA